ncbi:uncharacterized protein G2W53_009680 [Senna tora]|uniref:Uncharacterized protein n=1 Tax=Senna tora TaxID=362788 RepID=A0A835C8E2_9FABA|nr:uncharacterized protein G2W53_009680 [Senna tora]
MVIVSCSYCGPNLPHTLSVREITINVILGFKKPARACKSTHPTLKMIVPP